MPIWLRDYTFNEIKKFYNDLNNSNKDQSIKPLKSIDKPQFDNSYKVKK